jgi:hypothetical protein
MRSMKRSASPQRVVELEMGSPMRSSPKNEYAETVFVTSPKRYSAKANSNKYAEKVFFASPKRYSAKMTRKATPAIDPFEKWKVKKRAFAWLPKENRL